ncbi:uncharacterized protein PpBr36_10142 [Pyricularia pennisetigena]|uniref:uncharacterized protein n=1 Tax=Pyricularia pennisetigena TaxID=1578925 RepID=UPI0011530756|nr:uncharacterized protein PpBr36_10142 [Pyricularia pennisetigena]TLS21421.1 hypothetical protein PpBr36_10142 [Pyricularia pennisetigena]
MVSSLALLTLASGALALKVTSPDSNTNWSAGEKHTIKWESVSSDQPTFNIYLSNKVTYPPTDILIASDVKASDGSFEVESGKLPAGNSFTINLTNGTKTEQIYAQSNQFNVTGGSSSSSSSSSSKTASGSSTAVSSTRADSSATASPTASGSGSATTAKPTSAGASGSSSTATGSGSAASATSSKTPNSANGKIVVSWIGAAALAALAL